MDEIIMEKPWNCGENDCPVGWHMANYWVLSDGTYSLDHYADGDHETIEEDDLPTCDDVAGAWQRYYADCVEAGTAPLDELPV